MAEGITLADAQQVLAAQPFTGQVGARLTEFGDGAACLEIPIDGRHHQQYGVVHGGVLAYAADNALTFAAGSVLGPSVLTAGMSVSYLSAVREGVLRARARVAHHNSRLAVCTVEIDAIAPSGEVTRCAVAQGTVLVTGTRTAA